MLQNLLHYMLTPTNQESIMSKYTAHTPSPWGWFPVERLVNQALMPVQTNRSAIALLGADDLLGADEISFASVELRGNRATLTGWIELVDGFERSSVKIRAKRINGVWCRAHRAGGVTRWATTGFAVA